VNPIEPSTSAGLAEYLEGVRFVLFDFDGPLVDLFAELKAPGVAARLLGDLGRQPTFISEDEFPDPTDPHGVLRGLRMVLEGRSWFPDPEDLIRQVELALTEEECKAARSAAPTPGAAFLVESLSRRDRRLGLAITSNNASVAIHTYLEREESAELRTAFCTHIYGRSGDPDLMKPNPDCVGRALDGMECRDPRQAVLIGDSTSDFLAASAAGVRFVGYAPKPRKQARLRSEGVPCLIAHLDELKPWAESAVSGR